MNERNAFFSNTISFLRHRIFLDGYECIIDTYPFRMLRNTYKLESTTTIVNDFCLVKILQEFTCTYGMMLNTVFGFWFKSFLATTISIENRYFVCVRECVRIRERRWAWVSLCAPLAENTMACRLNMYYWIHLAQSRNIPEHRQLSSLCWVNPLSAYDFQNLE